MDDLLQAKVHELSKGLAVGIAQVLVMEVLKQAPKTWHRGIGSECTRKEETEFHMLDTEVFLNLEASGSCEGGFPCGSRSIAKHSDHQIWKFDDFF